MYRGKEFATLSATLAESLYGSPRKKMNFLSSVRLRLGYAPLLREYANRNDNRTKRVLTPTAHKLCSICSCVLWVLSEKTDTQQKKLQCVFLLLWMSVFLRSPTKTHSHIDKSISERVFPTFFKSWNALLTTKKGCTYLTRSDPFRPPIFGGTRLWIRLLDCNR